jgi:hypothetical protein
MVEHESGFGSELRYNISLVYHGRQLSSNTSVSLCKEVESITLILGHNNFHEDEFNSQVYNQF